MRNKIAWFVKHICTDDTL